MCQFGWSVGHPTWKICLFVRTPEFGASFEVRVLRRNLKSPVTLAGLVFVTERDPIAAVAVGMWKPAFGAGFQAPRAG
jgi:hypothetical protein